MSSTSRGPRTLAEELRGRGDDALAALFRARPDLATPVPDDTSQVASRAVARASVLRVLDQLDEGKLGVLEALAVATAPIALPDVRALANASADYVDTTVRALRDLALVWGTDDDLHVVRTVYDILGPHPAGLGPPAKRLDTERVAALITDAESQSPQAKAILDRLAAGPPVGRIGRSRRLVSTLHERGLLDYVDDQSVVLPREVGLYLRGGRTTAHRLDEPPDIATTDVHANRAANAAAGAAIEAVRAIGDVLERWSTTPPTVLRSGGVSVREVRETAERLDVPSEVASFLIELARIAGLLDRHEDRELGQVWIPTEDYDDWRDESLAARWSRLARSWLDSDRMPSLAGTRDHNDRVVHTLAYDLERRLAPAIRRTTLEAVGSVAPLGYLNEDDVLERVRWSRPRRGELRDDIARATIREATTLGIVASDSLVAPGRELLDGGDGSAALAPLLPDPVRHLLIQADLTAVAPGPLERTLAERLTDIADVESRGGATVFRFTDTSIRRALDRGWPADQLHSLVQELSATPVPQPLTYLIDDVARRHGTLRVGNASVYVRCDDPAELDALLADTTLAMLRLRRVAATVALTDAPADVVLERLDAAGQSPVAEAMDGSLHVPTAELRRAKPRSHHEQQPESLPQEHLAALVRAVRTGDQAADQRPAESSEQSMAHTLALLRDAAEHGWTVWLAYLDQAGAPSERFVDPVRVDSGWLTAYDHRSEQQRDFAVHRIGRVSVQQR